MLPVPPVPPVPVRMVAGLSRDYPAQAPRGQASPGCRIGPDSITPVRRRPSMASEGAAPYSAPPSQRNAEAVIRALAAINYRSSLLVDDTYPEDIPSQLNFRSAIGTICPLVRCRLVKAFL